MANMMRNLMDFAPRLTAVFQRYIDITSLKKWSFLRAFFYFRLLPRKLNYETLFQ